MEGLNRIIFLVLGLVTVIIFFAVLTGRINLKDKLPQLSGAQKNVTVTPAPTLKKQNNQPPATKTTSDSAENKPYKNTPGGSSSKQSLTSIPATGASTIWIFASTSLLAFGFYLRKRR